MNEAETRAEHVDPALAAAGWGVVEGSRIRREYPITLGRLEGHGRRGKPLIADYVLAYRNIKLAVIEAKAWDESLTEGVGQAKDYSLTIRFAYSTNGQAIYAIDMQEGTVGKTTRYPRQALARLGRQGIPPDQLAEMQKIIDAGKSESRCGKVSTVFSVQFNEHGDLQPPDKWDDPIPSA